MADVLINAQAVINAGQGYTVPGSQEIIIKAVRTSYDGSGAAGSFVPTLRLVAPGNITAAECPVGQTLAAGASADVTWFPGVDPAATAIRFDVNNVGDWLSIETTDASGNGVNIRDDGAGGITLVNSGDGDLGLFNNGNGDIRISATKLLALTSSSQEVLISAGPSGGASILAQITGSGDFSAISDTGNVNLVASHDPGGVILRADGSGGILLSTTGTGDIKARVAAGDRFRVLNQAETNEGLRVDDSGHVFMFKLPTMNPGGSGQLWNNAGVVNIT